MKANSFVSVRHTHEHFLFFFDHAIYSQRDRQSACGRVAPSHGEHVNRAPYDDILSEQPWTLVYDTVIWAYDITCQEKRSSGRLLVWRIVYKCQVAHVLRNHVWLVFYQLPCLPIDSVFSPYSKSIARSFQTRTHISY